MAPTGSGWLGRAVIAQATYLFPLRVRSSTNSTCAVDNTEEAEQITMLRKSHNSEDSRSTHGRWSAPFALRNWLRKWPFILFVLPALVVYTIIVIIPLVQTFVYSFTDFDGINRNYNYIGLENYRKSFDSRLIVEPFKNTIAYALAVPVIVTALAIPLAVFLNGRMKSRNIQRAVFFFPSILSALFLGYVWTFILSSSKYGMVNSLLVQLGFDRQLLLADPDMAMILVVVVTVWSQLGWHAALYIANLQTIDETLYEAASIDGASSYQKFRYITLPGLAPAMTVSVALLILFSLKIFDLPFALTEGGPGYATTMMTQSILSFGLGSSRVGLASAMSFLFFIIIAVVTFFQVMAMSRREKNLT